MLKTLVAWFKDESESADKGSSDPLDLAAAALMVEVALADHHLAQEELEHLQISIMEFTSLSESDCKSLIETAMGEVDKATSLHQFTRLLNETFTLEQKNHLLVLLWKIAHADQVLDSQEEHTIRRIADLLHLRHSEFIQAKHKALKA